MSIKSERTNSVIKPIIKPISINVKEKIANAMAAVVKAVKDKHLS